MASNSLMFLCSVLKVATVPVTLFPGIASRSIVWIWTGEYRTGHET